MVLPLTLLIVLLLLYFNTKSFVNTGIIVLALPFSMVGATWFLFLANYHLSVAVWVGIIALLGVSAEMGVVMLLYLEISYNNMRNQGLLTSLDKLKEAIFQGAVRRIRPVVMTVTVLLLGLAPILIGHGAGSDVMKRIAAPMFGGIITALIIQLAFYPAIFYVIKKREVEKSLRRQENSN
jgi:Cu(I)/Ag(I) efflux system membrane protein CusA/SilA